MMIAAARKSGQIASQSLLLSSETKTRYLEVQFSIYRDGQSCELH